MTTDTCQGGGSRIQRRRKHARAEEICDAALALIVEKGFDATRTEEIAARAGIAKGTLYSYFPSKEGLLKAAITSPAPEALAQVRPLATPDGCSTDVLRRVLSGVWAQLQHETVGSVLKWPSPRPGGSPTSWRLAARRRAAVPSLIAGAPADRCLDDRFIPKHVELVLRGLCCDPEATGRGRARKGR